MEYTLITGAASGLGNSFAKLYAKDKENLILVDINEEKLQKVTEELKTINSEIDILTYVADVSNIDRLKEIVKDIDDKNLFVSRLINSAGFGDREDF